MNRRFPAGLIIILLITSAPSFADEALKSSSDNVIDGSPMWVAHVARRSEASGDFATAILAYNQLLKREPNNTYLLKKIMRCQEMLEKTSQNAQAQARQQSEEAEYPALPDVTTSQLSESPPSTKSPSSSVDSPSKN